MPRSRVSRPRARPGRQRPASAPPRAHKNGTSASPMSPPPRMAGTRVLIRIGTGSTPASSPRPHFQECGRGSLESVLGAAAVGGRHGKIATDAARVARVPHPRRHAVRRGTKAVDGEIISLAYQNLIRGSAWSLECLFRRPFSSLSDPAPQRMETTMPMIAAVTAAANAARIAPVPRHTPVNSGKRIAL